MTRVNNFIKTVKDTSVGYKANFFYSAVAALFGYNGANTYAVTDLAAIDQSQATCKWA